jgi:coenzyme F420-reducing hydrogenase beta subunit
MSSDEEATLFYWYLRHRKQKCKKYWVHLFFTYNLTYSSFARVLDQDPVKFRNLYRMNIESFKLIGNCGTGNKDTNSEKA